MLSPTCTVVVLARFLAALPMKLSEKLVFGQNFNVAVTDDQTQPICFTASNLRLRGANLHLDAGGGYLAVLAPGTCLAIT